MENFEALFINYMDQLCQENPDPSHDLSHVLRVVRLAKKIAKDEGANLWVVVPAAYLHDCVYISKSDSRRKEASRISADKAVNLLSDWKYPEQYYSDIHHAILTHSFSANLQASTLEAKVVQDADRLDAIGAVGIMRCFGFSGLAKRPFYDYQDPFSYSRELDDKSYTLDHFYTKLLKLTDMLHTDSAKKEAVIRLQTMNNFLADFKKEIFC